MTGIPQSLLLFSKNVVIFSVCMIVIRYVVLCLELLIFGCRSTDIQEQRSTGHSGIRSTDSTTPSQHPTIRRFTTVTISGIIDSIIITDSVLFTLRVRIVSSDGQSEQSPAAGQILNIIPEFVLDEHAGIDPHALRNRDFHLLRSGRRGDTVHGTILYDNHSQWKLIGIGVQ
jgi:hypothetical protein